jgi:hypothetical protein
MNYKVIGKLERISNREKKKHFKINSSVEDADMTRISGIFKKTQNW